MPPVMSLQYSEEEHLGGLCCLHGGALLKVECCNKPKLLHQTASYLLLESLTLSFTNICGFFLKKHKM